MAQMHHKILQEMEKFYKPIFKDWPRVYDSLLQPSQHCALLNKYHKNGEENLQKQKYRPEEINISCMATAKDDIMNNHSPDSNNDTFHDVYDFDINENFRVFTARKFPGPQSLIQRKGEIFPYYLMDLASLLPVLSLDIQPDELVLDMCSAPGGKAIAIFQFLSLKGQLVCNDESKKRIIKLRKVINEYIPQPIQQSGMVNITNWKGEMFGVEEKSMFDKILVDAPCSMERHVIQDAFQYRGWSVGKMKEKVKLQTNLLLSALRSVKPGGSVTYSTCSISPWENGEVVAIATKLANEEGLSVHPMEKQVLIDSSVNRFPSDYFHIHMDNLSGILVLPSETSNWGPMYFSKILRES